MRTTRENQVVAAISCIVIAGLTGCSSTSTHALTSAEIAPVVTEVGVSDGDLWANCWSDDGNLYAANGDGAGFGFQTADVVMNRITGSPEENNLSGETLAVGDQLSQVWSGGDYTRKPTGMLCVNGSIYVAVEDLALDFNEAPAATIARSDDHGETWSWDTSTPMFDDHTFTTIWFADYGQDSTNAPDSEYAYAFGLDGNWRTSYTEIVPDPTELFLARVPVDSVQDRAKWEFFAGEAGAKEPTWTSDINEKRPVLVDERRVHQGDAGNGMSVLSQGGVLYLPALDRYLYTSWTEHTFEFYEAPEPWGPWTLFQSEDFGLYPWTTDSYGGYGVTAPSKFMSEDGLDIWIQSNVCPCAPAGMSSYWFGLRPVTLSID
ncbi:DUF4185 domain-containing protein [Actinomycetaceae bacterium MB13-C1-2]|nr:DUF4185 domain-containing protein [Actinomycetaceae bacterium MB13-C1-2]